MKELPPSGSMDALWRDLLKTVNRLIRGGSNAAGTVTLTVNKASTVVTNANVNAGASPSLTPASANAASALATTYVSSVVAGAFTITHANNSQADRTFFYSFTGSLS